jgi:hypothetical protein
MAAGKAFFFEHQRQPGPGPRARDGCNSALVGRRAVSRPAEERTLSNNSG